MTLTRNRMLSLFAIVFAVSLVLTIPLAAAVQWSGLPERGFSARSVTGSLWSGEAYGAAIGSAAVGDIRLGLSPLALFTGSMAFTFSPLDPSALLPRGRVALSSSRIALDDVTAILPLVALGGGVAATLALQDFNVQFGEAGCVAASGGATATLAIPDQLLPGAGSLVFSGSAVCDGETLLLPLTGQTGGGDAGLFVRVSRSGSYDYDLMVTVAEPAVGARLAASGFVADGGRFRLRGSGKL